MNDEPSDQISSTAQEASATYKRSRPLTNLRRTDGKIGSRLAVVLGAIALAALYCHPIFGSISNWGIQDWDRKYFHQEVARQSVGAFELPLWNPYACGGMALLANPQSRILTPFFLLHLAFGVPLGFRLEIVLHIALAFLGVQLLASASGVGRLGSIGAGAVYAFSSYFAVNLMTGMPEFLPASYLPFLAWLLIGAVNQRQKQWGIAICLTLMFWEGGHYVAPFATLFIVAFLIAHTRLSNLRHVIRQLATIAVVAIGLSAVKLFPAIELMTRFPRKVDDHSGYSFESLLYGLFSREQSVDAIASPSWNVDAYWPILRHLPSVIAPQPGHGLTYGMDENGVYVGLLGAGLATVGLLAEGRRRWRMLIVFGIFLWLSFGERVSPSLWDILNRWPLFDSMRVAQRFRMVWLLALAILAGLGIESIRTFVGRAFRRPVYGTVVGAGLLVVLFADLFAVGFGPWRDAFPIPAQAVARAAEFKTAREGPLYDARGPVASGLQHSSWSGNLPNYYMNRGTIDCQEDIPLKKAARPFDSPGYRGEAYVDGTAGEAAIVRRTPSTLSVHARLASDGVVLINQNFYPGWWTSSGTVIDREGLLGVALGPGTHNISLRFLPMTFVLGALVTVGTIGFGAWPLLRRNDGHADRPARSSEISGAG